MTRVAALAFLSWIVLIGAAGAQGEDALRVEQPAPAEGVATLRHRGWPVLARVAAGELEARRAALTELAAGLRAHSGLLVVVADAPPASGKPRGGFLVVSASTETRAWTDGGESAFAILDPSLERQAALPAGADVVKALATLQAERSEADLRPAFAAWGLRVRRQGRRPTCSVCVTAGALEFALAVRSGQGRVLSAEFLNWTANEVLGARRSRGQFFHHLLAGFERYGVCSEASMSYRKRFKADLDPSPEALAEAGRTRDAGLVVHWIKPNGPRGASKKQLAATRRVLARGFPVAAGSYHSLLFVGYRDDPALKGGGEFYTFDSGSGRESRMSYAESRKRLNDLFWVEGLPPRWDASAN